MKDYIVCEKRGSRPRIHVKICQHRCEHSETCQAFQDYMNANARVEMVLRPTAGGWSREKGVVSAAS